MKCRRCREIIFSPIELASAEFVAERSENFEREREREASVKNEIKEKKEENE